MTSQTLRYKKWKYIGCDYVYNPSTGDPAKNIEPRTPFVFLSHNRVCPTCDAGKEKFHSNDKK